MARHCRHLAAGQIRRIEFGIYYNGCFGKFDTGFVMVGYQAIDTFLTSDFNLFYSGYAAVY